MVFPYQRTRVKEKKMTTELKMEKNYASGMFLLGGIISLVFGILLITRTQGAIEIIMILMGLWWLIQGLFNLLAIFIDRSQWGWKLLGGIFGVIAGLLVLNFPLLGGAVYFGAMMIILGFLGLLFGVAAIIAAFQGGGWGAGLLGIVSIIIGLLMIFNVFVALNILFWIFAILLIVQGAVGIFIGVTQKV
jgi:uncharacterized membrane protein HdeD (DUF308 family)